MLSISLKEIRTASNFCSESMESLKQKENQQKLRRQQTKREIICKREQIKLYSGTRKLTEIPLYFI